MVEGANIYIWGKQVGAVLWNRDKRIATFEFDPKFTTKDLDLAPLTMPLNRALEGERIYSFPSLPYETFKGLPGLLSDSLPDAFGNQVLDAWLAKQGRNLDNINPVERLCYTGKRGMGALEFEPDIQLEAGSSNPIEISELVDIANKVLDERNKLEVNIHNYSQEALNNIIKIGTSAGGARAKAIIAYNEKTGEVKSGQVPVPKGFSHWIIKFDGVTNKKLSDPAGYGKIEYAYNQMAAACNITIPENKLFEEGDRHHFMTKRFDRKQNQKLHLQSLCGIAHFDYNNPLAYSYEQLFQVMRMLRLPYRDAEELYRRMVFNVIARNQDDHTKNFSFRMDQDGKWHLSPAYDITYAFDPSNKWLHQHQLSINGKRKNITKNDLLSIAKEMNIKKADAVISQIITTVSDWPNFAEEAEIPNDQQRAIGKTHLTTLSES